MDIDQFVSDYAQAALWSSLDDETPMDENHTEADLAESTRRAFKAECTDFLSLLDSQGIDYSALQPGQVAHDFWLTRNGHGAGFWDRGLGQLGNDLTKWAHSMGTADLYVGDDGLIYQYGSES